MRSKPRSEPVAPLDFAVPTTAADVEALRAARERSLAAADWRVLDALGAFGPPPPRRTTSEGWEPFRL